MAFWLNIATTPGVDGVFHEGAGSSWKRNKERMAERLPESDDQSLKHFLFNSPWDERPVIDQVAEGADAIFRDHPDTVFYIDETGFVKKGGNHLFF